MFYLGVVGSRQRCYEEDYKIIESLVLSFYQTHKRNLILVSGGCVQGADNFAERIAKKYGIPILIYYPNIQEQQKIGNYKKEYAVIAYARNTEIAKKSNSLLALVSSDRKGGTEHTIQEFQKYNKGQELLIR